MTETRKRKKLVVELSEDAIYEPVAEDDIPPEFKKLYKPLGMENHHFNILFKGIVTHGLMFYYLLYLWPMGHVPRLSLFVAGFYAWLTGLATAVGSHRYWSHHSFEASTPFRVLLMLFQTAGFQSPIFKWTWEHRLHHKYMDTNADPYSAHRGFWFSHILWLFQPSHPELIEKSKNIDISDMVADPVVRFQAKYYWELFLVVFFIVPMGMCQYFFPELTFFQNLALNFTRCGAQFHFTFLVNSVAHLWGNKPYDKYMSTVDNKIVSIFAVGEGWHNYHHTFPWDYRSAELAYTYNFSTVLINFMARIGWAWNLKTVSHKLLVDRINRTGDTNHPLHRNQSKDKTAEGSDGNNNNDNDNDNNISNGEDRKGDIMEIKPKQTDCWGWGDKMLRKEDVEITETIYARSKVRSF